MQTKIPGGTLKHEWVQCPHDTMGIVSRYEVNGGVVYYGKKVWRSIPKWLSVETS